MLQVYLLTNGYKTQKASLSQQTRWRYLFEHGAEYPARLHLLLRIDNIESFESTGSIKRTQ